RGVRAPSQPLGRGRGGSPGARQQVGPVAVYVDTPSALLESSEGRPRAARDSSTVPVALTGAATAKACAAGVLFCAFVQRFLPSAALRSRVASIDVIEVGGGDAVVLPSTSAVLGFQYRGRVRAGEALLAPAGIRSEEHTSELQSRENLVC